MKRLKADLGVYDGYHEGHRLAQAPGRPASGPITCRSELPRFFIFIRGVVISQSIRSLP